VRLEGDEGGHLVRVLRARPGDAVRVFDGCGREAACTVVEVDRKGASLEIGEDVATARPKRRVILVTAIPRGERMQWLVEKSVEVGVARILPLAAARSVRKAAGDGSVRRWARAAVEAAKQCGRADVPDVEQPLSLEEALAATEGVVRTVAVPGAAGRLDDAVRNVDSVVVFVGPEGGFDARESALLAERGATSFGLGPLILRVETAAVVATWLAAR
jgi:16S rRNA (uracil1498-N3)-methyltransferase